MNKIQKITQDEMLQALHRSGYIMESEVSNLLSELGFFVETNQVITDQNSGKSREIDLIAEYYDWSEEKSKNNVSTKLRFVFEIKNNNLPLVLLTKFKPSPNSNLIIEGLKEFISNPLDSSYPYWEGSHGKIIDDFSSVYTQYCSFQRKKSDDELMALHPTEVYEGLSKITQYCEEELEMWNSLKRDKYFRHWLCLPVLLINKELYELSDDKLNEVNCSVLAYNYHFNRYPTTSYVFVVTKKGLPEFLDKMTRIESEISKQMKLVANKNKVKETNKTR